MKNQESCLDVKNFLEWRVQLYNALDSRRETVIELVDSLSSNQQASSVVELSLNPLFRRDYNSLYKGIQEFLPHQTDNKYSEQVNSLLDAISLTIPTSKSRPFNLLGIDTTPYPRPYSATLADKTFIHYPNPIKGNKPISIGHCYSVVCALPGREHLSVLVADSLYSQRDFIGEQVKQKNLVTITRVRSNRVYNPSIYSRND